MSVFECAVFQLLNYTQVMFVSYLPGVFFTSGVDHFLFMFIMLLFVSIHALPFLFAVLFLFEIRFCL